MMIGLGCWGLGSESYGRLDESESKNLLGLALDSGVEFFDTAPLYGQGLSESRLGNYLPKTDNIKIATKAGIVSDKEKTLTKDFSPDWIIKSLHDSLRRLKQESVYLLQLHSPDLNFESEELMTTLSGLKDSGKVQKIGVSLKNPNLLGSQINLFQWDAIQFNYSIIDQRIAGFKDLIEQKWLDGVHFIAKTPLNFGFLGSIAPDINKLTELHHLSNWPKRQLESWMELRTEVIKVCSAFQFNILECALRFPIDSKLATIVIPGAMSTIELRENINAFQNPLPMNLVQEFQKRFGELPEFGSPYRNSR